MLAGLGSLAFAAPTASSKPSPVACISPAGEDLNAVLGTRDALVAPFCGEIRVGDRWRSLLRAQVAGADGVFPAGHVLLEPDLDEDFLARLVAMRYVVDAGTKHERTYRFSADSLLVQRGVLPDGSRFVRWASPSLHPLPPGDHTVHQYVTLSSDFWDGIGVDPALNLIPAGESLTDVLQFTVTRR